jgi:hypothetical protein
MVVHKKSEQIEFYFFEKISLAGRRSPAAGPSQKGPTSELWTGRDLLGNKGIFRISMRFQDAFPLNTTHGCSQ